MWGGGQWQRACGFVEVLASDLNSSGQSSVLPTRSAELMIAGAWATQIAGRKPMDPVIDNESNEADTQRSSRAKPTQPFAAYLHV